MATTKRHYVEVSPGVDLYVEETGAGRPLVFIPGWTGTTESFTAPPVGSGASSGSSWGCWNRLTAGQMLPLCSHGEQMENRSADVAGGL